MPRPRQSCCFILYALPWIENFVPFTGWIARGIDHAWYRVTPWIAKNVIGWTHTISVSELSNGDRATDYIAFLCIMMFMGHFKPYTFFAGLVETVGGALLFFERTTLLGALIAGAAMVNVVMLNFPTTLRSSCTRSSFSSGRSFSRCRTLRGSSTSSFATGPPRRALSGRSSPPRGRPSWHARPKSWPSRSPSTPRPRARSPKSAVPAPAELALDGNIGDDAVAVRLTRLDEMQLPLLRERFRWINPASFE